MDSSNSGTRHNISGQGAELVLGDARGLPLPDRCARLVVTSPPYFGLRDYGVPGEIGSEDKPDAYVEHMISVLDEMERVLTPDGSVFVVIGDKYARTGGVDHKPRGSNGDPGGRAHRRTPQKGIAGVRDGSLAGMPYRVALAAVEHGWVWRQEIIWRKTNPLPESVRSRCVRAHETILHLTLTNRPFTNDAKTGGGLGHDVWDIPVQSYRDPAGQRHPAIFPERLVDRIVTTWSAPDDLVVDPFMGSGTTPLVASRLGRRALGNDLNPEYVALAMRRLDGDA